MMKTLHRLTTGLTTSLATGVAVGALTLAAAITPAQAAAPAAKAGGTRSLATVLAADGARFDKRGSDFDITDAAVRAVLEAKPNSPVKLLTQGSKRATAFLPTDDAFGYLVRSLKGFKPKSEAKTFAYVARLVDVDTLETILLYHVVAGTTLTSPRVLAADGSAITTAAGKKLRVVVTHGQVILVDRDPDAYNARVDLDQLDINRGNRQVAHGIDRVLRPIDL